MKPTATRKLIAEVFVLHGLTGLVGACAEDAWWGISRQRVPLRIPG